MTRLTLPDGDGASKLVCNPERLSHGTLGPLLREANRELGAHLDQRAAFQRLTERLSPSRPVWQRPSYLLAPATLLVFAAFAAVPTVFHRMSPDPAPLVAAEDPRGYQQKTIALVPSATQVPASASPATAPPEKSSVALNTKRTSERVEAPGKGENLEGLGKAEGDSAPRSGARAPEPQPSPTPAPAPSAEPPRRSEAARPSVTEPDAVSAAPDCLSLARRGHTRDAEACFVKTAEGTGLAAEMALYEVARLRRDVLSDPPGALQALAEYRKRFPSGSLRREADMSHLELLLQLGRTDEALKQSGELLSSSSSGERAAELHLLRGHILRKTQARFAEAAHEYELAERAGARASDITYFRALCLDALGQNSEAAALFSEYLDQPQHAYASDARKRLERLKP